MKLRPIWTTFQWMTFARNWYVPILLNFNLWKNNEVSITRWNGSKLYFPYLGKHTATGTVSEIFFYKAYSMKGFIPQKNWTVVDIGANMGAYSLWCNSKARNLKIWAYEPMQRNFKYLEKNTEFLNNVYPFQQAVGNHSGTVIMNKSYLSDSCHSLYGSWTNNPNQETEEVPMTTLKEIVEKTGPIDLLKVDCEGAEWDIIMTSPPIVFQLIKRIVVEWHPIEGHSQQQFMTRLWDLGYVHEGTKGNVQFWQRRDIA